MRRLVYALTLAAIVPCVAAWTWPVRGPVLQTFSFDPAHPYAAGEHRGIAIGAATGAQVVAPAAGTVTFAGTVPTNGKSLTIVTPAGLAVSLTHLGSISVAENASVAEGDVVGTVGPSGTPELDVPYVHLGIREASSDQGYLDPLGFLPVLAPPTSQPEPAPTPAPAPVPAPPPAAPAVAVPQPAPPPAPAPVSAAAPQPATPPVTPAPAPAAPPAAVAPAAEVPVAAGIAVRAPAPVVSARDGVAVRPTPAADGLKPTALHVAAPPPAAVSMVAESAAVPPAAAAPRGRSTGVASLRRIRVLAARPELGDAWLRATPAARARPPLHARTFGLHRDAARGSVQLAIGLGALVVATAVGLLWLRWRLAPVRRRKEKQTALV